MPAAVLHGSKLRADTSSSSFSRPYAYSSAGGAVARAVIVFP